MRIALCDDNRVHLDILKNAVNACEIWRGEILQIDSFISSSDLLRSVRSGREYEYIFLDIKMPELSGFDIYAEFAGLDKLSETAVIFVSAHLELLPEVFALRAYGFLPKPYNQDRFNRTVKSVIEQKSENQFYYFIHDGVKDTIPCRNILYFETTNYTTSMYPVKAAPIILHRKSLYEIERELSGYGFFQCNRSVLVNLRHCSGRKGNLLVIKHTGANIEISRQKLKEFDNRLIRYKMGDKDAFRVN